MDSQVSVPLRGVGCITPKRLTLLNQDAVSVPLRGVGCIGRRMVCGQKKMLPGDVAQRPAARSWRNLDRSERTNGNKTLL